MPVADRLRRGAPALQVQPAGAAPSGCSALPSNSQAPAGAGAVTSQRHSAERKAQNWSVETGEWRQQQPTA